MHYYPTIFPNIPCQEWGIYHTVGQSFFYALLIKVHVPRYQPPHHNCFHHMIMLKFVVTRILLQGWNQMINTQ